MEQNWEGIMVGLGVGTQTEEVRASAHFLAGPRERACLRVQVWGESRMRFVL